MAAGPTQQFTLAPPAARLVNSMASGDNTWKFLQILKAWTYLLLSASGRLLKVIWL